MTCARIVNTNSAYNRLLIAATLLLPVALLLNLGIQPLLLEEPRRALVAMELLDNGNLWVPTLFGELYYNKPPVFNWLLLLSVQITGRFHEWVLRLPTVLSLLGMGGLVYFAGRRYVDPTYGWTAALLTVCSVDLLFYFSMLAEIDLFYSLVTFASILAVFHFYQQKSPYALFLSVYGLSAIGFLTKGLPSILFAGISVVIYLGYKRAWKWLFSAAHLTGILLFITLTGAYFVKYAQYESPQPFLTNMWAASSNRSVLQEGKLQLPLHLFTFPLDTLKNVLPASLLIVYGLGKVWWRRLWQQELLRFSILAFSANFLIYWISPGGRQRYIYMLFPFLILIFTYLYWQNRSLRAGGRLLHVLSLLLGALLPIGSLALALLPEKSTLHISWWAAAALGLASLGLFLYLWRRPTSALPGLLVLMILYRILFDLSVLPQRAQDSDALRERQWAQQVDKLAGAGNTYLVKGHRAPFTFTFYFNRLRRNNLQTIANYQPDSYYILEDLEPENWQTLSQYENRGRTYYFGRFTKPPPNRLFREREQRIGTLREY